MPVPTNISRPALPYQPQQSLPNNTRFDLLQSRPPTAAMLDAEFNALTDDINMLAQAINDVQVGNIPGAGNPLNANKLLKTDGNSNISWTLVTPAELEANAVTTVKINDGAVTAAKIGSGAVTALKVANNAIGVHNIMDNAVNTLKITDGAVTTVKIVDGNVTTAKLEDGAVTAEKMAVDSVDTNNLIDSAVTAEKIFNGAVTTDKIVNAAVTAAKVGLLAVDVTKISSGNAAANTVLTTDGAGNSGFKMLTQESIVDNTISIAKLNADLVKMLPFALLSHDGTNILSQKGIQSVTLATYGSYIIVFEKAAPTVNYVVTATAVATSITQPPVCLVSTLTVEGFRLYTARSGTGLGSFPFMLSVFAL